MPTALYLYNSRDYLVIDFYQSLKRAFTAAQWNLQTDFDEGLAGTTGDSFAKLAALTRECDAIIYAIGPLGPGAVQGNYEAGQVIQAQLEAIKNGRQLKVVPVLIGSADAGLIPDAIRPLWTQMDNAHIGGADVLRAVFQAVVGREFPAIDEPMVQVRRRSEESELKVFFDVVGRRAQKRGLTLFIGPYAASDVHGVNGPSDIGRELLKQTTQLSLDSSELLTHPWVAASASRLWKADYEEVWETLCRVLRQNAPGNHPLPLDRRIAALARAWQKLGSAPAKGKASWNGLLLVTTDQCVRLEKALWAERLNFARLRCGPRGEVHYERPQPGAGDPDFKKEMAFDCCQTSVRGTTMVNNTLNLEELEPILVMNLMDCTTSEDPPPLATNQHLKLVRERMTLPDPLPRHLQTAPFVMLGGGLLNPIVSMAFVMHFLPNFEASKDEVLRYVALHSWPGLTDAIRRFEQDTSAALPDWPKDVFALKRIDWPLPELVSRLAYHIVNANA